MHVARGLRRFVAGASQLSTWNPVADIADEVVFGPFRMVASIHTLHFEIKCRQEPVAKGWENRRMAKLLELIHSKS